MKAPRIDEVLGPVAQQAGPVAANSLLDLREAALSQRDAGKCLQCYFRIYGRVASRDGKEPIHPLRRWLENHVEVVAKDHQARELERLPLSLHNESLEEFCQEMMREFRQNRCYGGPAIELSLAFKETTAA